MEYRDSCYNICMTPLYDRCSILTRCTAGGKVTQKKKELIWDVDIGHKK